nr:radical SAM protein [Deltaproteobacteria bacterium]
MRRNEIIREMKTINSKLNALKLLTGDTSIVTMPQGIGFQNTCFCNLRCPHCLTHGIEENRRIHNAITMPEEMLRRVADEVLPTAEDYLFTVSGEPLAAPNFTQLLQDFLQYGAKLQIHTNATLFDEEVLSVLIPASERIHLSIDAATDFATEILRKGTRYRKLLHNVRLLTRALELLPSETKPDLLFFCTIMGSNIRELPAIVRLAASLGVKKVHGHFVVVFSDQFKNEAVENHKPLYNAYYEKSKQAADELGIELWLPLPFEGIAGDLNYHAEDNFMIIEEFPEDYEARLNRVDSEVGLLNSEVIESGAKNIRDAIASQLPKMGARTSGDRFMRALRDLWELVHVTDESTQLKQMKTYFQEQHKTHQPELQRTDKTKTIKYCELLLQRCYLSPMGDVIPCCYMSQVMGNVNESTVRTIWNSAVYDDL